ncbi:hypothetical protein N9L92_00225 [Saprospiraceae bacterium]|nr:hypothetical protein [Saprospiraceae bacterium]
MKFFKATFDVIVLRFYLMMAIVVLSYVADLKFLAILALPVFLSAMMGIKFEMRGISVENKSLTKNLNLPTFDFNGGQVKTH